MTEQPDLNLTPPARTAPGRGPRRGLLAAVLVLGAGAAGAWWLLRPAGELAALPAADPVQVPLPAAATPHDEPELDAEELAAAKSLPGLDQSDALIREWAARMSPSAELTRWLAEPDLIRRFTAVVSMLAEGKSPRPLLGFLAPRGEFEVREDGEQLFIDPASYARYDRVAATLASLEAPTTSAAYRAVRPLLVGAFSQIAPPGKTFHRSLDEAFRQLLAVEVPEGEVEVVSHGAVYAFAEAELEALTAAQKHLLRMGPDNVRKVQATLRQAGKALDLPSAR